MFKTLPIIPMWNGKSVGIGSMAKVLSESPQRKLSAMMEEDNAMVTKWMDGTKAKELNSLTKEQAGDIFKPWTQITQTYLEQEIQKRWGKDVSAVIKSSFVPIATALSNIDNINQRDADLSTIARTAWLDNTQKADLEKEVNIAVAKKPLDALIATANLGNKDALDEKILNPSPGEKDAINAYFAAWATEYVVTTTDKKQYKIIKNPDTGNASTTPYIVTAIT